MWELSERQAVAPKVLGGQPAAQSYGVGAYPPIMLRRVDCVPRLELAALEPGCKPI